MRGREITSKASQILNRVQEKPIEPLEKRVPDRPQRETQHDPSDWKVKSLGR